MAILKLPQRKIDKLLPEIEQYYRQTETQITPEMMAYFEDSVRAMKDNIEFAYLQMLNGLIAGLKKDQNTVRACYEQAIQKDDIFAIHINFLMAFDYLNDFEYEDKAFFASKKTMQAHDLEQLDFMIIKATGLGYTETALALLHQKQKSDIHFKEHYLIDFYEKLQKMNIDEQKLRALFCEIRQELSQMNIDSYIKKPSYLDKDKETLVFDWFINNNEADLLLRCQNICDEIMVNFEEKHQLNLNKLFIVIQPQEAIHVSAA